MSGVPVPIGYLETAEITFVSRNPKETKESVRQFWAITGVVRLGFVGPLRTAKSVRGLDDVATDGRN